MPHTRRLTPPCQPNTTMPLCNDRTDSRYRMYCIKRSKRTGNKPPYELRRKNPNNSPANSRTDSEADHPIDMGLRLHHLVLAQLEGDIMQASVLPCTCGPRPPWQEVSTVQKQWRLMPLHPNRFTYLVFTCLATTFIAQVFDSSSCIWFC